MDKSVRFRIVAEYSSGCFCERPTLNASVSHPTYPRMQAKRAFEDYARTWALEELQIGRYHTAVALLPVRCQHRDKQLVRLAVSYL